MASALLCRPSKVHMELTTLIPTTPKREKVRSAWISFTGRIVAQLIGAAATVGFGVVVFGTHHATADTAPAPTAVHETSAPTVLIAKPVRTKEGTVLVFVPLDRYQEVTAQMVEDVWAAANAH